MQFLLFTLYAPFAAMGEIALGERRMGYARPTRSGVLGMVAAALGWKRDDPGHARLDESVNFAVRIEVPGRPFTDYHTAQTPQQRRNAVLSTRRAELQVDDLNTVLSVREWRSDALYTCALWPRADPLIGLEMIADALRQPRFTLYLGRKAGPLGLPLSPRTIESASLVDAYERDPLEKTCRDLVAQVEKFCRRRTRGGDIEIAFDIDDGVTPEPRRIETRRDGFSDPSRHQFLERREGIV
jgi:CRISPR system Cascade subunit CasD